MNKNVMTAHSVEPRQQSLQRRKEKPLQKDDYSNDACIEAFFREVKGHLKKIKLCKLPRR